MSTINDATDAPECGELTETKKNEKPENDLEKPRKISDAKLNALRKAQEARKVKAKERAEKKQKEETDRIAKEYIETQKKNQPPDPETDSEEEEEEVIVKRKKKLKRQPKQRIIYISDESESDESPPPTQRKKAQRKKPEPVKRQVKPKVDVIEYKQEPAKPVKLTWDSIKWG